MAAQFSKQILEKSDQQNQDDWRNIETAEIGKEAPDLAKRWLGDGV